MWPQFTATARLELSRSHQPVARVDVLHDGKPEYTLAVTGGKVGVDADRPVRRNLPSCGLIDPTGQLTRADVGELLDPYRCEIAVWRGVEYGPAAARVRELAPQGVFALTSTARVTDGESGLRISIVGQDRSIGYQGPMKAPLAINPGTPIEDAIFRLLARRNEGVTFDAMKTGFVTGPLLYSPDINVWSSAQELAASVGAALYHDRTGRCVLALQGPASEVPVRVWNGEEGHGDGLLASVDRSKDSDTIHNVVRVESATGLIWAVAEDLDPTSPTYVRGRYGSRPAKTITNQHVGSVEQAQQAATARLAYELGRSETVSATVVPDPALDVQEVVTVHRPEDGLTYRDLVAATLDIPLGPTELMTVGFRKSILTMDGRALPVPTP